MKFRPTASVALLLGSLGLSALSGPAQADARQDVLSAIQRCAAFADDRTWLDCLYGSAQPMRAQLGLPAAPAAQIRLVPQGVASAPTFIAPPAYIAPAPTVPAYGAQTPTQQAPAGPPPLKRSRGGFMTAMFGSSKPVVANIRMRSFAKDNSGRVEVTLADGEIWRLNEADDSSLPVWRGAASRYVVNIYEGAVGSYNMEVSDDSHIYKVTRLN